MDDFLLLDSGTIYFIGIGGISMSGLAEILHGEGFKVSGSDAQNGDTVKRLKALGISIHIGQNAKNIGEDTDLIVYTAAIKPDNPEFVEAKNRKIPCIDRAALVGAMMKRYKTPVSVAGTHGKTTTTSMLTEVFVWAGKDPTVSLGGVLPSIGGNVRIGGNDFFLAETCEYCDSFLKFNPKAAIVLNIDADHMDYFKNREHIMRSFKAFAQRLPEDGLLVIHSDIENVRAVTEGLKCRVLTYGTDKVRADWYADEVVFNQNGASYLAYEKGNPVCRVTLRVPGMHNVLNSLGVLALSVNLGIDKTEASAGLARYTGADRRFQIKGVRNGVTVVDDYAHHPEEIRVTLEACERFKAGELWCVFQPHTYSRTKAFLREFALVLAKADHVVLLDIYAARETDSLGICAKDLAAEIEKAGKKTLYFASFEAAGLFLSRQCKKDDVLLTMGAGDVYRLGENILREAY